MSLAAKTKTIVSSKQTEIAAISSKSKKVVNNIVFQNLILTVTSISPNFIRMKLQKTIITIVAKTIVSTTTKTTTTTI